MERPKGEHGTMKTQELIYKRQVQRFAATRGVSREKRLDRVNANPQYVIVPCPRCGNKVRRKFGQYGKCEKCGACV